MHSAGLRKNLSDRGYKAPPSNWVYQNHEKVSKVHKACFETEEDRVNHLGASGQWKFVGQAFGFCLQVFRSHIPDEIRKRRNFFDVNVES
jgi:hypothetical protein